MRISLSEKDKSCFYKLLEIKDNNIEISNLLLTSFAYTDFIDSHLLPLSSSCGGWRPTSTRWRASPTAEIMLPV